MQHLFCLPEVEAVNIFADEITDCRQEGLISELSVVYCDCVEKSDGILNPSFLHKAPATELHEAAVLNDALENLR